MAKLWRKSLGEQGCRVYVFERKLGGTLYREVYLGGSRAAPKKSLGHRNKERAVADGYRLLAGLKTRQDALSEGTLTLETLFDNYIVSPSHRAKKPRTQREDQRRLERVLTFFGSHRSVMTVSPSDVERYTQARMTGELVGPRTVAADIVALKTALNWGSRERDGRGEPLLPYNPLRGVKLPVEKNPRRPVETYDRYLKLMTVAGDVDWRLPAALTLAESTGQRINSILMLRRADIDFSRAPHGWLRFSAEYQKNGREHWVPLTERCREVLVAHLERLPHTAEGWLFPGERKLSKPVCLSVMSKLLRNAYEYCSLKPFKGGLWHPFRRKWATERKHLPLKDVAEAGGWLDPVTLLKCYQQPDEETLVDVVLNAPKLYEGGVKKGAELTPFSTPQEQGSRAFRLATLRLT